MHIRLALVEDLKGLMYFNDLLPGLIPAMASLLSIVRS
jgi:hypothetical protein